MIRILFLSANPDNADTLLAGDELRQIEAALKGSRFEVIAKPAARLDDLPNLLRQSQPPSSISADMVTGRRVSR